jgi:hypothetical protein
MKAEAFEYASRHAQALLACEGRPYLEWLRCSNDRWKESTQSLNPIIRSLPFDWGDPGWEAWQRRAEVRLLQSASRYLATGELLQLEDPFGRVLLHSESADRMTFWSLGPNGQDDKGKTDPSIPWRQIWHDNVAKDLVISVERRKGE